MHVTACAAGLPQPLIVAIVRKVALAAVAKPCTAHTSLHAGTGARDRIIEADPTVGDCHPGTDIAVGQLGSARDRGSSRWTAVRAPSPVATGPRHLLIDRNNERCE